MRLWAGVSVLALAASIAAQNPGQLVHSPDFNFRKNETRLGGLIPGRSHLQQAIAIFGRPVAGTGWFTCGGDQLGLDFDSQERVQTIRMSRPSNAKKPTIDCFGAVNVSRGWKTGHGLRLGDRASRVQQLYGRPDSRSPSSRDGQRLELLYYAFDWAGPDVPQVMEVLCTSGENGKPGRVVEITLAASSL